MPLAGLLVLPYRSDRLAVIMQPNHALNGKASVRFAELIEYDFIGPTKGSFLDTLILRAAAELNRPLTVRMRVYGFEAVRSMVQAGLGLGIVPLQCTNMRADLHGVVQVPLNENWAVRDWKICMRDVHALRSPTRLLFNHLGSAATRKHDRSHR